MTRPVSNVAVVFLFAISCLTPFPGTDRRVRSSSRLSEQTADLPSRDGLWTSIHSNCVCSHSYSLDVATSTVESVARRCPATKPCCSLHSFALNCFAVRGTLSFFTPRRNRSCWTVLVALLLLLAGVEQNPGPAAGYSGDIQFGSININSAVHRAPLVHTTIADLKLDLLALQETKIDIDDPLAIKADVAPEGYGVLHVHRPSSKDTRGRMIRGGGLAIVYHHGLDVKTYRPQSVKSPTTFEHQLVGVKSGKSSGIIIANLYRPPDPWIAPPLFFDELADLLYAVTTTTGQDIVVCGDLNCHGDDQSTVDIRLTAVLDSLNLCQLVRSPTRNNNLLDVLACTDGHHLVHDVDVDEAGGVSDHRLVKARFSLGWRRWSPVTYPYR